MSIQRNKFASWLIFVLLLTACQAQTATEAATLALPTDRVPTATTVITHQPTATQIPTATEFPLPTAWPTPTSGPTPPGGSESIIFSISVRKGESYRDSGVFLYNTFLSHVDQIFEDGYTLQALSPDGRWILVNQGDHLYLSGLFGSYPLLLSAQFYRHSLKPATWSIDGSQIYWIEDLAGVQRVMKSDFLGRDIVPVTSIIQEQPVELLWADNEGQLAWLQGTCNSGSLCRGMVQASGEHAGLYDNLGEATNPVFDNSKTRLVFTFRDSDGLKLAIKESLNAQIKTILLEKEIPVAYAWSRDGKTLAVVGQSRSDYSGRNLGNHLLLLEGPEWKPKEVAEFEGASAQLTWSPDGSWILFSSTLSNDQGYQLQMALVEPLEKKVEMLALPMDTTSVDYIFIPRLFWLP